MAKKTTLPRKDKKKAVQKVRQSISDPQKAKTTIEVPELREETIIVEIIGRTPLIQNRLSDEVVDEIERTRMKGGTQSAGKKERPPLNPKAEMNAKFHFIKAVKNGKGPDLKKSKFGIPVSAFKKAMASVAFTVAGVFAKHTNAALNIEPDAFDLVELTSKVPPYMRRGVKNRPFLIYYQPVFAGWSCKLRITYDMAMITREDIVSMLRHAGLKVGIGNNRPEKGGECGTFGVGKITVLKN